MIKQWIKKVLHSMGYEIYKRDERQVMVNRDEMLIIPAAAADYPVVTDTHYILPKKMIRYGADLLYTAHNCDFIKDPRFAMAYQLGKATDVNETVLKNYDIQWRVHVLCWAAAHAFHLEGDFVDCGVNTGIFARAVMHYTGFEQSNKTYYLLDTFSGLDERYSTAEELGSDLNNNYRDNQDTLYNQVKETFKDYNARIIKGAVPETLPQVTTSKIAYLSIDMNCMQPEVDALHYFWDKLVSGGIIILDDYGYNSQYMNQKNAHDAFAKSKGVEILSLPTCQGMIIKP
jgi:O-methyltransferase